MSKKGKFLLGAGVGIGLGLLFAPQTGEKTRKDLSKKVQELIEKMAQGNKVQIYICRRAFRRELPPFPSISHRKEQGIPPRRYSRLF